MNRYRFAWALRGQYFWNHRPSEAPFLFGTPDHPSRTLLYETRREARVVAATRRLGHRNRSDGFGLQLSPQRVRIAVETVVAARGEGKP